MQKLLFWAALGIIMTSQAHSSPYKLVWSDEFDYTGLPDPAKWGYDVGGWGWGNNELQYYTANRLENARVEGGHLIIEVHKEPNYNGTGNDYTSARLLTKDKHDWQYGRFEARIKLPEGPAGLWPAFWMLGSNFTSVGWPRCGEIDIMEYVSKVPNRVWGTIHGQGYSGGAGYGGHYDFPGPVATEFHEFAVEWEPGMIRWYVDGIFFHSATPEDIAGTSRVPNEWYFDHPFFMILNVAVGGNWGGPLDPGLTFPVRMEVDYVRVYEKDYGMFDGYPLTGDWADTGDFMGWVNLAAYPWVYIEKLGAYAYAAPSTAPEGWIYILR